jgi:MazG family protein
MATRKASIKMKAKGRSLRASNALCSTFLPLLFKWTRIGCFDPGRVNFWGNRRNDSITFVSTGAKFERAVAIMARLRAPGGCPWDREQTFDTIKRYTLEETYEVLEAIDNRDWKELTGELGDLLLQVLFYAEMAQEQGSFTIDDVLDALSNKLIHRHPHVFGDTKADDSAQVLRNWEALKAQEKRKSLHSGGGDSETIPELLLESVSSKMPALQEAHKISSKAAHVGFDWPHVQGLFEKLSEETQELQEHLHDLSPAGESTRKPQVPQKLRQHVEDEVGDLFFVLVNIARYLSVDPESALRKTNRKFRRRFGWLEEQLRRQGRTLEQATLEEMEALWQQAKTLEGPKP